MKSSPLTYEFIKDAIHEQNCNIGELADVGLSILERTFPLRSSVSDSEDYRNLNKNLHEIKALLEAIKQFGWQIVHFLDSMDALNKERAKADDNTYEEFYRVLRETVEKELREAQPNE